jgi:hypothetical protein
VSIGRRANLSGTTFVSIAVLTPTLRLGMLGGSKSNFLTVWENYSGKT